MVRKLKIGVIDVATHEGGVRTFVDNFSKALGREGYIVKIVDLSRYTVKELNNFDILHLQTFIGKYHWKLLFARHPVKVLTVHGWVLKEKLNSISRSRNRNWTGLRMVLYFPLMFLMWNLVTLFFDFITCPSVRTAEENNLNNAIIISNAIFPKSYANVDVICLREKPDEVLFATYASGGGLKNVTLDRTIRVVEKLNKIIKSKSITLMVFGKNDCVKPSYPYIRIMGYSSKFLNILRSSDLFITGKTFPDLGYAEMEAGILGIPVAKFAEDYEIEEIIDGETGILAKSEDEMVNKLLNYISDLDNNKQNLGNSFYEYIKMNKSWNKIITQWNKLFMKCLQKRLRT